MPAIIVEGVRDREKLKKWLSDEVDIYCTYGTLNSSRLASLLAVLDDDELYIFTDNDRSGRRIRAELREHIPDAIQLYTRREYAGVEGTPDLYILEKLGGTDLYSFLNEEALEILEQQDKDWIY